MKTGQSRGLIKKSVQVVSNDPQKGTVSLRLEAAIKAEVGFENFTLNIDTIRSNERVVKDTYIDLRGMTDIEVEGIKSSSELVSAEQVQPPDSVNAAGRILIRVTIGPGLKPGLLGESVTVSFKYGLRPNAQLYLYGVVVEDIEVTPLALTFVVADTAEENQNLTRKLTVTNYNQEKPLEILDAHVPGGHLDLSVQSIEKGRLYEITAIARDIALTVDSTLNNNIIITTNNPEQRMIKIPFRIVRRR